METKEIVDAIFDKLKSRGSDTANGYAYAAGGIKVLLENSLKFISDIVDAYYSQNERDLMYSVHDAKVFLENRKKEAESDV